MNHQMQFKFIIPLSMIYMSVMIFSDLLVYKFVRMPFGFTTAAMFVFPVWFILNDIVAEVYGPKICWKMIWTGYCIQAFFNICVYAAIHLPSPTNWNNQESFNLILGNLLRVELSTLIVFLISININIRLLTKWKLLLQGRYFWLRSVGSSFIAEAVYSALNIWLILMGSTNFKNVPVLVFWSFFLKLTYTAVLAYPASIFVKVIKNVEGERDSLKFNLLMS